MPWNNQPSSPQPWGNEKEEYEVDPAVYADYLIKCIITSLTDTIRSGKNVDQGYVLYSVNVDTLELLCRSNKWLSEDYQKKIDDKALEANIGKIDPDDMKKTMRLSKIKFGVLLDEIFSSRMKDEELSM